MVEDRCIRVGSDEVCDAELGGAARAVCGGMVRWKPGPAAAFSVHGLAVCVVEQKTAYEVRISDWSSDVCSSDLSHAGSFIAASRSRPPRMILRRASCLRFRVAARASNACNRALACSTLRRAFSIASGVGAAMHNPFAE